MDTILKDMKRRYGFTYFINYVKPIIVSNQPFECDICYNPKSCLFAKMISETVNIIQVFIEFLLCQSQLI